MKGNLANAITEARILGQSIWLDNLRRGFIVSGELKRLIELGVTGLTFNQKVFERAISGSGDYDSALSDPIIASKSARETLEALRLEDVRTAADLLRPVYDHTGGEDGYVSLESNPDLAHDTAGITAEVKRLNFALNRPNVLLTAPGTPEGVAAMRELVAQGINIHVTPIFSLDAYRHVREAYIAGLEELARRGGSVSGAASIASFSVSRLDATIDALLQEKIMQGHAEFRLWLGEAAISNSRLAYQAFKATFSSRRFAELRARGAKPQRVLWFGTNVRNPAYPDLMYVESLIGRDTINALANNTLAAFLDHGRVNATLEQDVEGAERTLQALDAAGIDLGEVTARLLARAIKSRSDALHKLLPAVEEKKSLLLARGVASPGSALAEYSRDVSNALADLKRRDITGRIWRKDHTVWKPEPAEITNRLGWLDVADKMLSQAGALKDFAAEVRSAGIRHVVLLGMGGSSLGPEVVRQTFGATKGFPELIVLDSTVPASVRMVERKTDPARTLFIVSSKSGTTTEPLSFYAYFRAVVEKAVGARKAGRHFVAITDPGTSLAVMAYEKGFRRVFLNPADIGGRYSILSYFGLVPMALAGVDVEVILDRAERMGHACASCVPVQGNPGAWLGAVLGSLAVRGLDKLTLSTSPSISSFGLWAEQLVAESTGKQNTGIIPVAREPVVSPECYGRDRLFVYLRLDGDDNADADRTMESLRRDGHPVVRLDLRDKYDLGAEFFRWEFATAVAGSILGIHPFDQPDVQRSKDITSRLLEEYRNTGKLPEVKSSSSVGDLLQGASPGKYLAIMAYINESPVIGKALRRLRQKVLERHNIPVTLGYGPRFLHSTGQLHKGGPDSGLFLQITAGRRSDLQVPGQPYTFGVLADAQALGDLQALQDAGRQVARIHLASGSEAAIRELTSRV